jgi:hypothetical protein
MRGFIQSLLSGLWSLDECLKLKKGRERCRLLLLAKRTGVRKEHVVTMLALQLPNCAVTWIRYSTTTLLHDAGCRWVQNNIYLNLSQIFKENLTNCQATYWFCRGQRGLWVAFLGTIIQLFHFIPGIEWVSRFRFPILSSTVEIFFPEYWDSHHQFFLVPLQNFVEVHKSI